MVYFMKCSSLWFQSPDLSSAAIELWKKLSRIQNNYLPLKGWRNKVIPIRHALPARFLMPVFVQRKRHAFTVSASTSLPSEIADGFPNPCRFGYVRLQFTTRKPLPISGSHCRRRSFWRPCIRCLPNYYSVKRTKHKTYYSGEKGERQTTHRTWKISQSPRQQMPPTIESLFNWIIEKTNIQ